MRSKIETITGHIIRELYRDGHPDKAVLASLRNASSLMSQRAQTVWPLILENLDKEMLSHDGQPTWAENAVYAAIRFYALHQQGQDAFAYGPQNGNDQEKGLPLFQALANLRKNETTRVALDRRVKPILATTNVNSIINSLAHLVSILKAANKTVKIDYAALAEDLFEIQMGYEQANKVRLRWGQQYFWTTQAVTKVEGSKK